jgi:FixJ family two-component response regulator
MYVGDTVYAKTVCVIDDDLSVRHSTSAFLRSLGLNVVVFEGAEEFMASDAVSSSDCVVCDIEMGKMSGLALQARVRAGGYSVPFIFVTAYASTLHRKRALADGALCVLEKPVEPDALANWLKTALDGQ